MALYSENEKEGVRVFHRPGRSAACCDNRTIEMETDGSACAFFEDEMYLYTLVRSGHEIVDGDRLQRRTAPKVCVAKPEDDVLFWNAVPRVAYAFLMKE